MLGTVFNATYAVFAPVPATLLTGSCKQAHALEKRPEEKRDTPDPGRHQVLKPSLSLTTSHSISIPSLCSPTVILSHRQAEGASFSTLRIRAPGGMRTGKSSLSQVALRGRQRGSKAQSVFYCWKQVWNGRKATIHKYQLKIGCTIKPETAQRETVQLKITGSNP